MSYVENTLSKDEKIILDIRPHWSNYIISSFISIISLIALCIPNQNIEDKMLMFFALIVALYFLLKTLFREMVVTNKRVINKCGIISVKTEELKNSKIEAIDISRNFIDVIFGCGSIYFSGTGTSKVVFADIDNPVEVKAKIEETIASDAQSVNLQNCSDTIVCSACKKQIAKESKFCPYCGASQTHRCPNCGEEFKPGANFCSACGCKLADKDTEEKI